MQFTIKQQIFIVLISLLKVFFICSPHPQTDLEWIKFTKSIKKKALFKIWTQLNTGEEKGEEDV